MENKGCNYCDNYRITNGNYINDELVGDEIKVLGTDVMLYIDISENHLCLNGFNDDDIISCEINYCPMCGRKL